ncbi:hypothetical protein Ocin01_10260 [Orchesella cincta]|uniref:Uncharacterized protein n=1 Tax=Orchesella cincta TaxID=48709 RepID=A0A1D2MTP4_ORCCI|nr:hypothetical protein Ocin01_10260 [Orchesella cincta]
MKASENCETGNAADVHSTGNVGLVRMDPEVDGRLASINYFTPSYMSDINAVLCASPMFGTAWGSRRAAALFPIVIQILLEKKYLSLNNDILTCRRVNKASKLNVDDLLLKKQSCR